MVQQPTLKIVPIDKVILHEHVDPLHVQHLAKTLKDQGILKNPILVTKEDDEYVALDGATRVTVLGQMGVPVTLVQVVPRDGIRLQNWHHAVVGNTNEELLEHIDQIDGLVRSTTNLENLRKQIEDKSNLFGLASPDGVVFSYSSENDQKTQIEQLNHVVDSYRGKSEFYRTLETDPIVVQGQIPGTTALLLFPRFSLDNILLYAKNHMRIPAGISRHLVDQRALRVNIPLDVLAADKSLPEKNEWLEEYIRTCYQNKTVRTYEETTVVFND